MILISHLAMSSKQEKQRGREGEKEREIVYVEETEIRRSSLKSRQKASAVNTITDDFRKEGKENVAYEECGSSDKRTTETSCIINVRESFRRTRDRKVLSSGNTRE